MHCTRTVHMRCQDLVSRSCVFAKMFEHGLEIVFHYCTARPCHKINVFKCLFQGFCSECLNDIVVMLVSLTFNFPQEFLISW